MQTYLPRVLARAMVLLWSSQPSCCCKQEPVIPYWDDFACRLGEKKAAGPPNAFHHHHPKGPLLEPYFKERRDREV